MENLAFHTPPPPQLLLSSWKMLDTRDRRNPMQHGKKQWSWGGGGWEERTLGLFVKSFLPAFREKQHRNIFSHHTGRLVKFGWILTYLKISVEMAATWFLPGAIPLLKTSVSIIFEHKKIQCSTSWIVIMLASTICYSDGICVWFNEQVWWLQ